MRGLDLRACFIAQDCVKLLFKSGKSAKEIKAWLRFYGFKV